MWATAIFYVLEMFLFVGPFRFFIDRGNILFYDWENGLSRWPPKSKSCGWRRRHLFFTFPKLFDFRGPQIEKLPNRKKRWKRSWPHLFFYVLETFLFVGASGFFKIGVCFSRFGKIGHGNDPQHRKTSKTLKKRLRLQPQPLFGAISKTSNKNNTWKTPPRTASQGLRLDYDAILRCEITKRSNVLGRSCLAK